MTPANHHLEPWPASREALIAEQTRLAAAAPAPWRPGPEGPRAVGGCFVCYAVDPPGASRAEVPVWAAAVLLVSGRSADAVVVAGEAAAPYEPGFLALREGPILEAAVRRLAVRPEVLLVDATGRDHPRRAGLALHLGARLDIPTIGITRRPLIATGAAPAPARGSTSPLHIGDEIVGYWVRTRSATTPLAVHPGWRVEAETAVRVVLGLTGRWRTPLPLREARRAAREARARTRRR